MLALVWRSTSASGSKYVSRSAAGREDIGRTWTRPAREIHRIHRMDSVSRMPPPTPRHPSSNMPSVEEVFDDDTDFPLPDTPSHGPGTGSYLRNTGTQGALLEEITDDDVDTVADAAGTYDMDMDRVAEQGRGFGDNVGRPKTAPSSSSQNLASTPSSDLRPSGDRMPQQGPMGGIMGDFLKMQQAEEARMKKLEQQLGSGMIMKDQQEFKAQVITCVLAALARHH